MYPIFLLGFETILCPLGDGGEQLCFYIVIALAFANKILYVKYAVVIQAGFEHALWGDTDTVAGAAERPGICGYNAYAAFVAGDLVIVRCRICGILYLLNCGVMFFDGLQNADIIPMHGMVCAGAVEGHLLNKAHTYWQVFGKAYQGYDIISVLSFHDYCIQFDLYIMAQ